MSKEQILVTVPVDSEDKAAFKELGNYKFVYKDEDKVTKEDVLSADIIFGSVDTEFLKETTHLKWFHSSWAGVERYLKEGVLKEDTILTNSTGAYGLAISEYMVGYALMLMKKLDRYYMDQKDHKWTDEGEVRSVWNSNTLVLGLGDIGSNFAMKIHALGSRVVAVKKHLTEKPSYIESMHTMKELDELLPDADIIAITLPGTSETEGLFDLKRLRKCKKDAIIINVGRGCIIKSGDLNKALREGIIGGAAIDVMDPEPLDENDPLWDAPNIIVTPHISGNFHLPETLRRVKGIFKENLELYSKGKTLINTVDFNAGYRKFTGETVLNPSMVIREHPLILASASPRRKDLLSRADIPFEIRISNAEESSTNPDPVKAAEENSLEKAKAVIEGLYCFEDEEYVVLSADTVVSIDGDILGKPAGEREAFSMLKRLQGRTHKVVTGVTLARRLGSKITYNTFHEITQVSVYPITDELIHQYIATGEPMDKAGAYGIQGSFAKYIRNIKGDYSNVVGLPIGHVFKEYKKIKKRK